jgi:gliding motility-associated lipoprotein GldH
MNSKLIILIAITLSFAISSCRQDEVFRKYQKLDNYQWNKDKNIVYNFEINDIKNIYDVLIAIRHTPQYPYANLQLNMSIISPSGQERTKDHDLYIRNNNGSFKGEGMGDIYDVEFLALEKINFTEQGKYTVELHSLMPKYSTPALMEIGLIIKKSK